MGGKPCAFVGAGFDKKLTKACFLTEGRGKGGVFRTGKDRETYW